MKSRFPLGELTPQEFLKNYWQKQPLLIRQAFPGFESPLQPEDLAGLACEEHVEARIVMEKGGKKPWQLRHGPFKEKDFKRLPATHWTLLAQGVDRHVPEVADILEHFRFMPNWRIDDLMISFAPEHGSVGPHLDSYDVFLLQAYGRREWQISRQADLRLLPDLDLRILANFEAEQRWVLEPGDMLYLPPGVAHYGIALDDCMTFSIGFLAPSHADLMGDYVENALAGWSRDQRYTDPDLALAAEAGELTAAALAKVRAIVRQLPLDDAGIDRWFAHYISQTRGPGAVVLPPDAPYTPAQWRQAFHHCGLLRRDCRALFTRRGEQATLFMEGEAFPLSAELAFAAPLLSGQRRFTPEALETSLQNKAFLELLTRLTNQGYLYFYEDDGEGEE
jgi:50S ribosomal protein L16 3-hydroxylase